MYVTRPSVDYNAVVPVEYRYKLQIQVSIHLDVRNINNVFDIYLHAWVYVHMYCNVTELHTDD